MDELSGRAVELNDSVYAAHAADAVSYTRAEIPQRGRDRLPGHCAWWQDACHDPDVPTSLCGDFASYVTVLSRRLGWNVVDNLDIDPCAGSKTSSHSHPDSFHDV